MTKNMQTFRQNNLKQQDKQNKQQNKPKTVRQQPKQTITVPKKMKSKYLM